MARKYVNPNRMAHDAQALARAAGILRWRSALFGGSLTYAGVAIGVLETGATGAFCLLVALVAGPGAFAVWRWHRRRLRVTRRDRRFLDGAAPMPRKRAQLDGRRR